MLPAAGQILTAWTVQPLAIALIVVAAGWYARRVALTPGWPAWRTASFGVGLLLFGWATNGVAQVYVRSLFWMWLAQSLALLLVVPFVLLAGAPIRLSARGGLLRRLAASPFGRVLANPLVGPAVVPLLAFVLFFGPIPGWAAGVPPFGWVLQALLVLIGAGIVLPLTDDSPEQAGSLAVGFAMGVGVIELLIDAVPGIVLRLSTSPVSTFWDHRLGALSTPLRDQQFGGGILWAVAELLDLPFLVLVFRRWVRADAAEASRVDSVLEAERVVRNAHHAQGRDDEVPDEHAVDAPWWLTDPALRDRFR